MNGEKRNNPSVIETSDENIVLLELAPTRHYQLWNKWELYEYLLNSDKPINFDIEDFPMKETELQTYIEKLKR